MCSFAKECVEQLDVIINDTHRVTFFVENKYVRGGDSRMGLVASTRGSISVVSVLMKCPQNLSSILILLSNSEVCGGYMIYNRGYMHRITCMLHIVDGLFVYGTEVYGEYLKVLKLNLSSTSEGNFVSFGSVSNYNDYNEDWPVKLELEGDVVKATSEQGIITHIQIEDLQSC